MLERITAHSAREGGYEGSGKQWDPLLNVEMAGEGAAAGKYCNTSGGEERGSDSVTQPQ